MLSRKAKYALKALRLLAGAPDGSPLRSSDIAREEHIPAKFLEIILADLKKQGLLLSRRGPGGGYSLGKSPQAITLGGVIRLIDGPLAPIPCASETAFRKCDECADVETCAIRIVMKRVRDATASILDGTTLLDFAALPGPAGRRHSPRKRT